MNGGESGSEKENFKTEITFKDDRVFSLLHQELSQILVLCFP